MSWNSPRFTSSECSHSLWNNLWAEDTLQQFNMQEQLCTCISPKPKCRPGIIIKAELHISGSNSMYASVEVLGTRKYNSVQGSRPVSGYEGAPPPSCLEPHIDFQPFSLFFNLSSPVLFVATLLPFVHKRSLPPPPLLVNVTGRELVWGGNYYDNGRKEN